jgi:16S rRNA (uracil1498-N3)-methyltransferase
MTAHRFLFYSPGAETASPTATIDGAEHHHLSRVVRLGEGDDLYVTNGRGVILRCRATHVGRSSTTARVEEVCRDETPERQTVLALAVLKKDAFETALAHCVELGVTRCVPFRAAGSQMKTYSWRYIERLRRLTLSSIKQAFLGFLPEIEPVTPFEALLERCAGAQTIVGSQMGGPMPVASGDITVVVGPEAGLTDGERAALERVGARFVSASPNRLRSETAAISLISLLRATN